MYPRKAESLMLRNRLRLLRGGFCLDPGDKVGVIDKVVEESRARFGCQACFSDHVLAAPHPSPPPPPPPPPHPHTPPRPPPPPPPLFRCVSVEASQCPPLPSKMRMMLRRSNDHRLQMMPSRRSCLRQHFRKRGSLCKHASLSCESGRPSMRGINGTQFPR